MINRHYSQPRIGREPVVENEQVLSELINQGGGVELLNSDYAAITDLHTLLTYAAFPCAWHAKKDGSYDYCMSKTSFLFKKSSYGFNLGHGPIRVTPWSELRGFGINTNLDASEWGNKKSITASYDDMRSTCSMPVFYYWPNYSQVTRPQYTLVVGVSISGPGIQPINQVLPPGVKYPVDLPHKTFEEVVKVNKLNAPVRNGSRIHTRERQPVGSGKWTDKLLQFASGDVFVMVGEVQFGMWTFKPLDGFTNLEGLDGLQVPFDDLLNETELYLVESKLRLWIKNKEAYVIRVVFN